MASQNTPLSPLVRFIFGFVAFNALLGALSLIIFSNQTQTLFFWEIKPAINADLFGVLYLGGAVVVGWITYQGTWENARFLIPVLVAAGFFISLTTLLHIDRFTAGVKLAYWLVIYVGAPLLALGIFFYYERAGADWSATQAVLPATRLTAILTGLLVLGAGLVLLANPNLAVKHWAWTISPLMLRIFASWFNAFGVGLLWFYFESDWQRLAQIANLMIAASALDLTVLFLHWGDLKTEGATIWIYCFHLLAFGLIGLAMHGLQGSFSRSKI